MPWLPFLSSVPSFPLAYSIISLAFVLSTRLLLCSSLPTLKHLQLSAPCLRTARERGKVSAGASDCTRRFLEAIHS
jgi:hypothetical protein